MIAPEKKGNQISNETLKKSIKTKTLKKSETKTIQGLIPIKTMLEIKLNSVNRSGTQSLLG